MDSVLLTCSFEGFQKTYLPPIMDDHEIDSCALRLVSKGLLQKEITRCSWTSAAFLDSTKCLSEKEAFSGLAHVAVEIPKQYLRNSGRPDRLSAQALALGLLKF